MNKINKKLYQTAGEKKEKESTLDTQAEEVIPKDQEWVNGKIVKIVKTGAKTQRVVIGVYYVDEKGNKIKGLKPVEGTIPRKKGMGGKKMYQKGGVSRNTNTDFFNPNLNTQFDVGGGIGGKFNFKPGMISIGPDRILRPDHGSQTRVTLGPSLTHSNSMGFKNQGQDYFSQSRNTLGANFGLQSPIGKQGMIGGISGETGQLLKGANQNGDVVNNLVDDYNAYGQVGAGLGYYPKGKNLGIKGNVGYGSEKSSMPGLNYGVTGNYGPATFNVGKDRQGVSAGFGLSLPIGGPSRRQNGGVRPFDVGGMEVEFTGSDGNSINPAGSMISGDQQKIYTDRSADNLSSSDTLYYNQGSGDMSYYDPETNVKSDLYKGYSQEGGPAAAGGGNYPQAFKPYLGIQSLQRQKQTGGMYENTVSAAGQGGPQLGVSSTIVGQETDPAIQQARLQGLQQSTETLGGESQDLIGQTRQQESIDQQQAEVEGMQAEQQSQQQTSALEGIAGQTAQTIGQNLYPNQGGGLGTAVKVAQGAAKAQRAANFGMQATAANMDGMNLITNTAKATKAMSALPEGANLMSSATTGKTIVVDAGGNVIKGGGSAIGAGLKSFATSGAGLGTIANLAGRGISKLSDDNDATKSNVGEYSGSILQSAGTGATIGSFFPGPGTAIGAVIGAGIGAGKQYFGTKKAKEAKQKYEGESRVRRNKGIRELNETVGSLYGSHMSSTRAGNLAQKTVSGQNLGRNVTYKHGGMMMGMPRYDYNS